MKEVRSKVERYLLGGAFCSAVLAVTTQQSLAACSGYSLTEEVILEKLDFPRGDIKDMATINFFVETRVCYQVTGCSAWRSDMTSGIKNFFVDTFGRKVRPSATLRFSVGQDRGWVSFDMDGNESMAFIPATSGLDQTIFPEVYLLDEKFKLKVAHRENCVEVSGFGSRTETTSEQNTKVIEAKIRGYTVF